jgi:hypothetical protein
MMAFAEPVHRLKTSGRAHSQVLDNKITGNSICKHVNSCQNFLVRGQAKLTGSIRSASEVGVVVPHTFQNSHEQLP